MSMAKTRFHINMLVVLAAVAVLVSGSPSTHRNPFMRPPAGLRSSVQQWDILTLDDSNIENHKKPGSSFAFRYDVGPTLTQSNTDGSDVSAELTAAAEVAAEPVVGGIVRSDESPEEHLRASYDAYGDEDEECEDGTGIVRTSKNSFGGGSDSGDSSTPLSGTVTSASILGLNRASLDSVDAADGGMNVRSPMESLKAIWRGLMEAPPSAAHIDEILQGAPYYASPQRGIDHNIVADDASNSSNITSITSSISGNVTQTSQYSHANPLRANGTDRESMYRQILSQFLTPLAAEGKRSLWLDQEVALRLKAAVLIAHRPELWRGIGEGLRPQLVRGVRLVTPLDETTAPGPTGVAPVHNIIATALSHSVGANLAFLNLQNVEKVRDSALAVGVDRAFLSKANILTALVEACEDSFVETARPAVVVIDDAPQWLLANEAAAEVVVEELKSVSSRVMFLAIAPPDVLRNGDFSPSARPAPLPPQTENAESSGEAGVNNPYSSFANLFNAGNGGPDSSSRTGTGTVGNNNRGFPFLPPGAAMPPAAFFSAAQQAAQRGGPNSNNVNMPPNMQPNMMGMPQIGAMIGRSFQVVVQNGTATMIPLPPTIVPGANNLPGGGPLSESALTKIIQDQHRAFMQQYAGNNSTAEGSNAAGAPVGISFPLFPPDMTTEEIQEFMQDPDNQAKIKQTLDSVVHALSAQMAQQFGQHLNSLQLQPGATGSAPSFVPNSAGNPSANVNPNNVEVKVQMIPLPPGMSPFAVPPFARPPPKKPSTENKVQLSDDKAAPSAIDKAMARHKPPSPPAAAQNLPGTFFRGMKKRGAADSASDAGSANGKTKGLKGRPLLGKPINKESRNQGSEVVDAEYRNAYSPTGMEITSLFVDYPITAPRDVTLKALWERLLDDEVSSRILRLNRRMISAELRRNAVKHTTGAIKALDQILRRQVMSKEEVRQALRFALQLQAGKHSILPQAANSNAVSPVDSTSDSAVPSTDVVTPLTSTPSTFTAVDVATATPPHASDGQSQGQLVLSQWALDTAFSTVLKTPTPRLGRPAARSKEDISSLVTDKHERSLIGNVISPQDIGVTYDMIGGLDEVKEMLRQCITYPLKYPRLYQEGVAAEAVKGVLLFGPPGTGKTMLAKAVATEGGATFLTIDTSTIENKWLGESEKNARAVFQLARRLAPCVIYLDEVDSILSSREQGDESSHGTLTSVKTTLMQEWDGLRTTKDRVVVIASTNRPFDLDEAVLRRLPRRILVDLPDLHTRQEILAVTLANNRIDRSVNFTQLAEKLDGYTGSDIKEVCREAVVRVAHERAQMLEHGADSIGTSAIKPAGVQPISAGKSERAESAAEALDFNAPLRAVTLEDFQAAMKKLKASVDDNGRELQKVVEWNNKYGEFKRKAKKSSSSSAHLSMYV